MKNVLGLLSASILVTFQPGAVVAFKTTPSFSINTEFLQNRTFFVSKPADISDSAGVLDSKDPVRSDIPTFQTPAASAFRAIPSFLNKIGLIQNRTIVSSNPVNAVPDISDSEVQALFGLWNDALATLDADKVAKRYAKNPVLLPTVSDTPRTDYESIKAYFVDFLQKEPQGVILESNIIKGDGFCMDAGIYEFTMGTTGDKVKARYTYVYKFEDDEW
eukprot:CAMPEP_0178919806 /NCGR_PEP_ID=MMETSP0786-20121207/14645_1 /TAXON_ID=186022 /ORGANISM="Thalassionema frauenfeldii, Strain CCMP 1798" /LENGTH=217 /DNA_ID=CAMNT_0020593785 /DNA_START=156 /DNA_END=806 /DNA_ORIENTATION=+